MDEKVIYIVDDDQDDRLLFRETINDINKNIKIVEFDNGHEFLTKIGNYSVLKVDLLLLDMNMPKMNGIETITAFRSQSQFADIPAVMLSTTNNTDLIDLAYKSGINYFSTKPISTNELEILMVKLLNDYID